MKIVKDVAGESSAAILNSPFKLGHLDSLKNLLNKSNIGNYEIETLIEEVVFPSIENWIDCDVKASPIINNISTDQYESLKSAAKNQLGNYVVGDGKVRFNMSAHFISIEDTKRPN